MISNLGLNFNILFSTHLAAFLKCFLLTFIYVLTDFCRWPSKIIAACYFDNPDIFKQLQI